MSPPNRCPTNKIVLFNETLKKNDHVNLLHMVTYLYVGSILKYSTQLVRTYLIY